MIFISFLYVKWLSIESYLCETNKPEIIQNINEYI